MMTKFLRLTCAALVTTCLVHPVAVLADASGNSGSADNWNSSKLKEVEDVLALQDYDTAIEKLEALAAEDPDNPDVLNLLGFSHRQQGRYEVAYEFYRTALEIKPKHLGANEYLGELYLQTGELDKAEERLAVLDKACFFGCKEYDKLKEAVATYKKKNGL